MNISDSSAGELASPVPRQVRNRELDVDSAFGATPGWKSSQGGVNSRVSDPVYRDLKTGSKEPSEAASLAPAREPDRGEERSQLREPSQEDVCQAEDGQERGQGAHRGEEVCQARVSLEQDTSPEPGHVQTTRDGPVQEELS